MDDSGSVYIQNTWFWDDAKKLDLKEKLFTDEERKRKEVFRPRLESQAEETN